MKNILDEINSRLTKNGNELQDTAVEITATKQKKEKGQFKRPLGQHQGH